MEEVTFPRVSRHLLGGAFWDPQNVLASEEKQRATSKGQHYFRNVRNFPELLRVFQIFLPGLPLENEVLQSKKNKREERILN